MDLQTQLDKAGVPPSTAAAIIDENANARCAVPKLAHGF